MEYDVFISCRSKDYLLSEKLYSYYLWLATRMGQSTVKGAPGLEVIQTYNLVEE